MSLQIRLPDRWTPEQAEFMHDLVEMLHNAVWDQYGDDLCEYWARPGSNRDLFEDDEEQVAP